MIHIVLTRVDSHHHLWDLSKNERTWLAGDSLTPINRTFRISDYENAVAQSGISKSILVQTIADYRELDEFFEVAVSSETVAGVVSWIDMSAADCFDKLRSSTRYQDLPKLVGIRDGAQGRTNREWLASKQLVQNVKLLAKKNLVFDLLVDPTNLPSAIELVKQCPETVFVLDHIGRPAISKQEHQPWQNLIQSLAKYENVFCKVSGMITEADWATWQPSDIQPYFAHVLESFSSSRIMFGSDWPVSLLAGSYESVANLAADFVSTLSNSEQELFWFGTATRVYRL